MQSERIFGLDLLRALAIWLVIICHAVLLMAAQLPGLIPLMISFGYLGVELFFVLSGFLIGQILLKQFSKPPTFATLKTFWIRRWFRTLPAYYLYLLINLALVAAFAETALNWKPYFFFVQNLAWGHPAFDGVAWSLSIEEWFYLSMPFLLFALCRIFSSTRKSLSKCFVVAALFFLVASTGLRCYHAIADNPTWDEGVRKIVIYRMDSLMFGVIAAFLKTSMPEIWQKMKLPLVVAGSGIFIGLGVFYFSSDLDHSFFARTFFFSLTSLVVFCFLPFLDGWRRLDWKASWFITETSIISYSLYLAQGPGLYLIGKYSAPISAMGGAYVYMPGMLFIALVVAAAFVTYYFFEKPTTQLRNRFS